MLKRLSFAGLLGMVLAACTSSPPPPATVLTPAAEAALSGYLGANDEGIAKTLSEARRNLALGALRAPTEVRVANVLLARGLTGFGVQALLGPRGMDLVSFEAKVPLPGPPNHMMTIWLGSRALAFRNASMEEMVDLALDQQRHRFLQRARMMANHPAMRDTMLEYQTVATSPEFALYRLEVAGSREALFSLLRDPAVYGVLVNEDPAVVEAFQREKAEMTSRLIRRVPATLMDPGRTYRELPPGVVVPETAIMDVPLVVPATPEEGRRP